MENSAANSRPAERPRTAYRRIGDRRGGRSMIVTSFPEALSFREGLYAREASYSCPNSSFRFSIAGIGVGSIP
jgi:hypothetical protein